MEKGLRSVLIIIEEECEKHEYCIECPLYELDCFVTDGEPHELEIDRGEE